MGKFFRWIAVVASLLLKFPACCVCVRACIVELYIVELLKI